MHLVIVRQNAAARGTKIGLPAEIVLDFTASWWDYRPLMVLDELERVELMRHSLASRWVEGFQLKAQVAEAQTNPGTRTESPKSVLTSI